jgi:hypothetical protein
MKKFKFVNKWVVALVALFGVSLISAGVFAAATITLNSGNAVNLGAGAIPVNVCDQQATISTQQTYIDSIFKLTTISLEGINYSTCNGKTITMAFKDGSTTYSTTWGIASTYTGDLVWGGTAGTGQVGSTQLTPIDTANSQISTIAIAAQ